MRQESLCLTICPHFSSLMSQCLNPVKIEKNEALLKMLLEHGVSANLLTSSMVSTSRLLSFVGIFFTFSLMSTVRYSSIKACLSPALMMEKYVDAVFCEIGPFLEPPCGAVRRNILNSSIHFTDMVENGIGLFSEKISRRAATRFQLTIMESEELG